MAKVGELEYVRWSSEYSLPGHMEYRTTGEADPKRLFATKATDPVPLRWQLKLDEL